MIIENMFNIGCYFAIAGLSCFLIGFACTFKYPNLIINKRPTLPMKWFLVGLGLFLAAFSWMIGGMKLTM